LLNLTPLPEDLVKILWLPIVASAPFEFICQQQLMPQNGYLIAKM